MIPFKVCKQYCGGFLIQHSYFIFPCTMGLVCVIMTLFMGVVV